MQLDTFYWLSSRSIVTEREMQAIYSTLHKQRAQVFCNNRRPQPQKKSSRTGIKQIWGMEWLGSATDRRSGTNELPLIGGTDS